MSQKNETSILILSLLITAGLIGGGFWWFTSRSSKTPNLLSGSGTTTAPQPATNVSSSKTFTDVRNVPVGIFKYGGSTSWAPLRLSVDNPIQLARPEFRLNYINTSGTGEGIEFLITGQLDIAQTSRSLLPEERSQAQQRGFSLKEIPIAIDGLAVAVNPNLNIPGLTIDQLRSIYTGKITNWNQLGGPNIAITAFSRPASAGGTVELFIQDILSGQDFGTNVRFVNTTTQAIRDVARTPGSIYFASAPEVVPQCSIKPLPLGQTQGRYVAPYQEPLVLPSECPDKRNKLNIEAFQSGVYPITRNLFVVVKQTGQREQQAGEAYANLLLSEQGQELISQAGFVKIR